MTSVFISHNYMDKPLARKIANVLNVYGIQTWIDEAEIKIGDSLIKKIRAGIDHVDFLIALISKYSVESEWVLKELDIAMNREIDEKKVVVLPILASKCDLPGFLKGKLYVDMSTPKNFSKNLPQLLARFDIKNISSKNELTFTSQNLSLADLIYKLSNEPDSVKSSLWKDFSYTDKQIFTFDEFRKYIVEYLNDPNLNTTVLVNLLNAYDRYTDDNEQLLNDYYLSFLDTENEELLNAVILSITRHKVKNTSVEIKIIEILKKLVDRKNIIMCLRYFYFVYFGDQKVWDICEYLLGNNPEDEVFRWIVGVLLYQFSNDKGIGFIIKLWSKSEKEKQQEIIAAFATLGADSRLTLLYIESPRLRDKFKEMILQSFDEENDLLNATIICALFLTEDLYFIFPRIEIWNIVEGLDDYSIMAFLEKISSSYNIANVFNSKEDIMGLKKMLDRRDIRIHSLVFDVLADIPSKYAIDILVEHEYEPQYYNANSIVVSLIKETNLKDYEKLYLACKQVSFENIDKLEEILYALCDFLIDENNLSQLIFCLHFNIDNMNLERRNGKDLLKFICDILTSKTELLNGQNSKIVKKFIKDSKRCLEKY